MHHSALPASANGLTAVAAQTRNRACAVAILTCTLFGIPLRLATSYGQTVPAHSSPLDALTASDTQTTSYADVIRLDPALDQIISPDARVQMLTSTSFGITEGPVWMPEGYLLFSDIAANAIYKWTPDYQLSVFLKNSGYTGDLGQAYLEDFFDGQGPLYLYNFGSNGITMDRQDRLVYCAQGDRAIIRIEKDGTRTVLANQYEGKRFSRPNDVVVKGDGAIYFTDWHPNNNPTLELPSSAVFLVKGNKVTLLANDFVPNGLAFSPDEKILYINGRFGIGAGSRGYPGIWQYDVRPDDTIGNGRLFVDMSTDSTPGGPDGMKVDRRGNIYDTGPGGIWIITPAGKHIGTIRTPIPATNLAFGDPDYRTLYITDRHSVVRVRLNSAGIAPGAPQA